MTAIKDRDYFFDNARAFLIFLVVFGHLFNLILPKINFYQHYTYSFIVFICLHSYLFRDILKNLDKTTLPRRSLKITSTLYHFFRILFNILLLNWQGRRYTVRSI